MQTCTLTRTGKPPLAFEGELVAESIGSHLGLKLTRTLARPRYHNLRVYRASAGAFVVQVEFVSAKTSLRRAPEPCCSDVYQLTTAAKVADLLMYLATVDEETGRCPATEKYHPGFTWQRRFVSEARAKHEDVLRDELARGAQRFARQVTEVLASDVFAERVE